VSASTMASRRPKNDTKPDISFEASETAMEVKPKKPLKVLVKRYPFVMYYDDEYGYYSAPYRFKPKLVSGRLGYRMPKIIDEIVKRKLLEKYPHLEDVEEGVVEFYPPKELELSMEETVKVIEELLKLPVKLRVSGFEELGLGELAREHNKRVEKHIVYSH